MYDNNIAEKARAPLERTSKEGRFTRAGRKLITRWFELGDQRG